MDIGFVHTPYDGSGKPFTIGLRPLRLETWLERDGTFAAQIAEKRLHYAERPDLVFVEEPDTREAQREVFDLVLGHLAQQGLAAEKAPDAAGAPLKQASLLVQEDLILMRRDASGWRLVAGSLCFPSSWSLREKFGHPLQVIHTPVPAFGSGSRNAGLIERIFDKLAVGQPVERLNWSVQAGDALHRPFSNAERDHRAAVRPAQFADLAALARCFIRVERQTLRKLPVSGDILFTIRIYLDPLAMLATHPDRSTIGAGFAAQLRALDAAQLDYKGLTADRDRLIRHVETIAV